jgi:hypothetical protein
MLVQLQDYLLYTGSGMGGPSFNIIAILLVSVDVDELTGYRSKVTVSAGGSTFGYRWPCLSSSGLEGQAQHDTQVRPRDFHCVTLRRTIPLWKVEWP